MALCFKVIFFCALQGERESKAETLEANESKASKEVNLIKVGTENEEHARGCSTLEDAGKDNSTKSAVFENQVFVEKKVNLIAFGFCILLQHLICIWFFYFILKLVDLFMCRLKKRTLQAVIESLWTVNLLKETLSKMFRIHQALQCRLKRR